MHIQDIRSKTPFEEIDYVFLKDALKEYAQPRNKIRSLLKAQSLIRVKKGLYIFGTGGARGPYSKEHLANLIYGPSAISLEYALSFYGLIPERVETLTSITPRRNKIFNTPVGRFTYHYLHPMKYSIGVNQLELDNLRVLMATQEKALCDLLALSEYSLENTQALEAHLFENLRIDESVLLSLNFTDILEIASVYQHHNLDLLRQYLAEKGYA